MSQFVRGHQALGTFVDFGHLCPGHGCAIERWLIQKAKERDELQWIRPQSRRFYLDSQSETARIDSESRSVNGA